MTSAHGRAGDVVLLVVSQHQAGDPIGAVLATVRDLVGRLSPSVDDGDEPGDAAALTGGEDGPPGPAIAGLEQDEVVGSLTMTDLGQIGAASGETARVSFATIDGTALESLIDRESAAGADPIVVIPVAVGPSSGRQAAEALESVARRVADISAARPGARIAYLAPGNDGPPPLQRVIDQLQVERSDAGDLAHDLVERAFAGDPARLGSFVAVLRDGLPEGTQIVVRGSAVTGESYETGRPFDADGPRTSDLDIVLIGDAAMAAWRSDAFAMPGVNTLPLYDDATDIAPDLEPARRSAQEIADRPVSLQAMARWFLELRSAIQGTPFLVLDG